MPSGPQSPVVDAGPDSRWVDEAAAAASPRSPTALRWLRQHRLAALATGTLLAVALLLCWLHWLAAQAHLPGRWVPAPGPGLLLLGAPAHSALQGQIGRTLERLTPPVGASLPADRDWLAARPRWMADAGQRAAWHAGQQALAEALSATPVQPARSAQAAPALPWMLHFEQGHTIALTPVPRGLGGLGVPGWTLGLLALGLLLSAVLVGVTQPGLHAALYAALASAHALLLAMAGAEALPGLGQATAGLPGLAAAGALAEAVAAAALVHLMWRLLRPRSLPRWLPPLLWGLALSVAALAALGLQAPLLLTGLSLASVFAAAGLMLLARRQGVPLADRVLPLGLGAGGALLAMSLVWWWLGDASAGGGADSALLQLVPAWHGLVAAALLAGPLLARPRHSLREWLVVLALAGAALALALLLHAGLDLDWRAALGIALGSAAIGFAAARPAIDRHLASIGTLSAERLFDSLYRAARALEQAPQRSSELVAQLLREVFDPLEVSRSVRPLSRVRVARDGTALAVPVPELDDQAGPPRGARTVLLRHARRGQRPFTEDDRQLAERLLEQLRRAVAYDRAVERGRAEERSRIAQDLHDDIGARLLTLMYKAPDSGIEEYIRHTLQDLKTLTRGLAAANPRLSHAAAEWKADISQRLHPTGCDLHWSFSADQDITLNAMQWSGLTRMLRELVNNILAHAQASQVEIALQFDGRWLSLQVADDGIGRAPEQWSHGLGLGGVRKRVKQLGGVVQWRENGPRGIRCAIRVQLDHRHEAASPDRGTRRQPQSRG